MKEWRFFLATGFGMIPGTIAYVLLGNQILEYSRYSKQILWITFLGVVAYIIYLMIG
ncbi:hypothetical protein [Petrocella sp. FN5]|uniref:hypothetical protein n=1 Tax=Petrocella sp. FN5 TaxID=3032002 RepID=UPI0023DC7CBF|nr:hypothetical protein [Petrocella sp. FN5]MDF1617602.1 hypothetical protein [Petrocella sp. FN5]